MATGDDAALARRTAIVLLIAGLAVLVVPLASVLLLIFAAVLVAALIMIASRPFRLMRCSHGIAVLLGFFLILAILGGVGWLFGTRMNEQFGLVAEQLPGAVEKARGWIMTFPVGRALLSGTPDLEGVAGRAVSLAFGAFGIATNLILIVIGAVYLALQPELYLRGIVRLFPKSESGRIEEALRASGAGLQKYLVGQFVTMATIGTLVFAGLTIAGVPSAAALGLIVALCNFVPLIGPFVGAVPGILIGFAQGSDTGIAATLVYFVAQQIEGNVLTPLVQRWAVSIPPALLLFALGGFGTLFGLAGIILAAPLTVVIYIVVTVLWTRNALGYDVDVPGTDRAAG